MASSDFAPMNLSDLFDRLFKLIGKTWGRSLVIAVIILGPAGLVMGVAADTGFSELATMVQNRDFVDKLNPAEISTLIASALWFSMGIMLMIIGTVIATVAITITACAEMNGEQLSWQEALSRTFHIRVLKVFGQYILQGILLGGIVMIPYALLIAGIAADSVGLAFLGGTLVFAAVLGAIYLGTSFSFAVPVICWEDADVIASFRRSWGLVRGNWWRTFGILFLMGIMVSFAVSIIMTPLYMVAFWDFFQGYFQLLSDLGKGDQDPAVFVTMLKSLGFSAGFLSGISSILQLIVAPLYIVVMYFDLRARKGEFGQPTLPTP